MNDNGALSVESERILAFLRARTRLGARMVSHSAHVRAGDVFVAFKGARCDAARFAKDALEKGAAAVLSESSAPGELALERRVLVCERLPEIAGPLAKAFYGNVADAMTGLVVTGTNGKTTVSFWAAQLMRAAGIPCASIGTIGAYLGDIREETSLTTPDAVELQRLLAAMHARGAKAYALEASSAGLESGRLKGLSPTVAGFTNLTREHMETHGTMARYCAAKRRIFDLPGLQCAVLNVDDATGAAWAAEGVGLPSLVTTLCPEAIAGQKGFAALNVKLGALASRFTLATPEGHFEVTLPHPGRYNVENLLTACAMVYGAGAAPSRFVGAIATLAAPPGRMERVTRPDETDQPLVIVDYAHTPDGFMKVLSHLAPAAKARGGKLVMLFGCCGERDVGKRPIMGEIAERLADLVVVSSDNPRDEDPEAIARDVVAGMRAPERAVVKTDRAAAIREAVMRAEARDIILLAGKGPETKQIVAGRDLRHNDAECARAALNERAHARADFR